MKNALILLAGGQGTRLNLASGIPKQFINLGSSNIIEYFLENLDEKIFDIIVIVCDSKYKKKFLNNIKKKFKFHNIYFTASGINRQDSSKKGILFSLANFILVIFPSIPLSPNPPGTRIPCAFKS